jgi:membrane protein implicated in regulation of membrane protease activity
VNERTILAIVFMVAGAALAVLEIQTLTIYLIAVALACFVAGAVALVGGGLAASFAALGVVTLVGLPVAHWVRKRLRNREADEVAQDDVGRTATVVSAESRSLRASYRGSVWDARLAADGAVLPRPGETLRIAAREGNVLVLAPLSAADAGHSGAH